MSFEIGAARPLGCWAQRAGKTTTISMVAGLIPADAGTITGAGEQMRTDRVEPKRHIGLVPQDLAIYP